jgi:TRAP-type C4-dicarboxylate transport system permease small subunit
MKSLASAYDWLLNALAVLSGALLGIMTFAVIVDVVARNIGFQPPPHTSAFVEYSLLYITLLAAPWLLRHKGHVHIEMFVNRLGPRLRRIAEITIYVICIGCCLLLFAYSVDITWINYKSGDYDIRSFDMPRWMLFACMPVSFGMLTVEFGRLLSGRDSLYGSGPVGE